MIDRSIAKKHAARWNAFKYPPNTEGLTFLIDTLAKCSESEQHCSSIVDDIVMSPARDSNGLAQWPDAAAILAVARSNRPEAPPSAVCRLCEGSGLVYAPFMRFDKFAGREIQIDASALCSCRTAAPVDHKMAAAGGGN